MYWLNVPYPLTLHARKSINTPLVLWNINISMGPTLNLHSLLKNVVELFGGFE